MLLVLVLNKINYCNPTLGTILTTKSLKIIFLKILLDVINYDVIFVWVFKLNGIFYSYSVLSVPAIFNG